MYSNKLLVSSYVKTSVCLLFVRVQRLGDEPQSLGSLFDANMTDQALAVIFVVLYIYL